MRVTVRIHRQHDMDLMSIYRNKAYHIAKEFKKTLVAYANGKIYVPPEIDFDNEIEGYVPTSAMIHINLSETNEADAAAIELLKHIKNGYRCSFIKAVFRSSCVYLPLLAYSDDSGFVMAKERIVVKDTLAEKIEAAKKEEEKVIKAKEPKTDEPEQTEEQDELKELQSKVIVPTFIEVPAPEVSEPTEDLDKLFNQMDKLSR